jgi:hypothetical protein
MNELERALVDMSFRESLAESETPLAIFLRRSGAFAADFFEGDDDDSERRYSTDDCTQTKMSRGLSLLRRGIAPDPTLPFSELAPLLALGPFARQLVALHPSTPLEVTLRLADDEAIDAPFALSQNPNTSSAVLLRLCTCRHAAVRVLMARDERADAAMLTLLFADAVADVRRAVVRRDDLSPVFLRHAASSSDSIQDDIIRHRNVTGEILELMAAAPQPDWRRVAIARHPLATEHALLLMAQQPMSGDLIMAVGEHPATPAALLERLMQEPQGRAGIALRPNLDRAMAEQLARDSNHGVRKSIAKRTSHRALLLLLAKDTVFTVRVAVAQNPHCPVLVELADDSHASVRAEASKRLSR